MTVDTTPHRGISELLDYKSPPLEVCQTQGTVTGTHILVFVEAVLLIICGVLMVRSLETVPFVNGIAIILIATFMAVLEVVQPRSWRQYNEVWNQYNVRGSALLFLSLSAMWGSFILGCIAAAVAVLLLVVPSLMTDRPHHGPIFPTNDFVVKARRDVEEEEAKYMETGPYQ